VIVIDSSAVIAILFDEPAAPALAARLASDPDRIMSIASYLETGTVLAGRRSSDKALAIPELDEFLVEAKIELRPVDIAQGRLALEARIRFGRGMGTGGRLNFGDTFSYALAKWYGAPLLFTGDDFSRTDIEAALG
jgi:ribonuclease VapC